jgi:hypothetical protein
MAVMGFFLTAVSAPCTVGMIHDVVTGQHNLVGALIVGGFFAILLMGGLGLLYGAWRLKPTQAPAHDYRQMERAVLHIAQRQRGIVTVADVALHTQLTTQEGQQLLETLVKQGTAQLEIGQQGELLFMFPSFRREDTNFPRDNNVSFGFEGADGEVQHDHHAHANRQRKG